MKWMSANESQMRDGGVPLDRLRRVDAKGASDVNNELGGYSIIQAN